MPVTLFDTHAHLTDPAFDADRAELISGLPTQGVTRVMDVACDVREAESTLHLLEEYDFIYGAVGMHPEFAACTNEAHLAQIRNILKHEKMLAVGEIGLDYHYEGGAPREEQKKWFIAQLELAAELNYPVILHIREAFGDCMEILHAHRQGLKGVMHCFSGSYETAKECLDLGLYIAFGGALTFHNAVKQADVAARLPLDRLVLETDCPYMTPVPFRGKRNDPGKVRFTAEKLAEVRGISLEEVCEGTYKNSLRLFELPLTNTRQPAYDISASGGGAIPHRR